MQDAYATNEIQEMERDTNCSNRVIKPYCLKLRLNYQKDIFYGLAKFVILLEFGSILVLRAV